MPRTKSPAIPPCAGFEILPGFIPVSALWTGEPPLYPSANSCQWAINKYRTELIAAKAMAYHRGRLMVHPQRLVEVMSDAAINQAEARFADVADAQ